MGASICNKGTNTGPSSFSHLTGGANKVIWEPRGPPHHPQPTSLKPGGVFSAAVGVLGSPGLAAAVPLASGHGPTPSTLGRGQGAAAHQPPSSLTPAPPRAPAPPDAAAHSCGLPHWPAPPGFTLLAQRSPDKAPALCACTHTRAHPAVKARSPSAEPEQ